MGQFRSHLIILTFIGWMVALFMVLADALVKGWLRWGL